MKRNVLCLGLFFFPLLFILYNATSEPLSDTIITDSSSPEANEIFSIETPEDLESILVDGYPMPWVVEILEDETIPEEDKYWLDCRIRSIIAQNLHTFFNRAGEYLNISRYSDALQ